MINQSELIVAKNESYAEVELDQDFYSDDPNAQARELDVLEQLNANLSKLDEIYGRLRFVLSEVKHVITRRSE